MAKITLKGTDQLLLKLSKLEAGSEEIAKKAVYEGAGIMADQVKANLQKSLSGSKYATGDLLGSLGIAPIDQEGGTWNTKVGFDGYGRNGTANILKARALESGTSRQRKRPFIRPAISQARERAKNAMKETINEEIKKITGG